MKLWCIKQSENEPRAYCLRKLFPENIFFYKWIEFSKSVCWVWNASGVCLHLILFPSSLRIMSWRKQKLNSIKNPWTAGHCIQPKRHIHSCSGSEIVVKQIFNLDHKLYTLQRYVGCKSQVENDQMFTETSLVLADFTDFF